jgi:hypothetical protein
VTVGVVVALADVVGVEVAVAVALTVAVAVGVAVVVGVAVAVGVGVAVTSGEGAALGSGDSPVIGQIALNREGLDAGRSERGSAAFTHLLVIGEDIDHRAGIRCRVSEIGIGGSAGVDQRDDVVAATERILLNIVVGPES